MYLKVYVWLDTQETHHRGWGCLAGRIAMHAYQIGLIDTAPPCPGSPLRACVGTKGGIGGGVGYFIHDDGHIIPRNDVLIVASLPLGYFIHDDGHIIPRNDVLIVASLPLD